MSEPYFELLCNKLAMVFATSPERDFSDCAVTFGAANSPEGIEGEGIWPSPSTHLKPLHDAQFVDRVWRKVEALLAEPVRVKTLSGGEMAVQVLGTAVFLRGKSGQLHPFLREIAGTLMYSGSRLVMVTEVPYGSVWLTRIVGTATALRFAQIELPVTISESQQGEYVQWLTRMLMRRIRAHHDLRGLRRRIADALCIDADAWRLCHRMHISSPLENKACFQQYNLCIRHKAELLEVERVAPNAVGVYAALCEQRNFPVTGEPTQRLKRYLVALGVSSRSWLLVLRDGNRLMPVVRQFYTGSPSYAACDVIKVMNGLNIARRLPAWLTQAIFGEWGTAGERRHSYFRCMEPSMTNLRHLVACVSAEFQHPDALQEEQLAEVVHWVTEPEAAPLTRTQRQRGWSYLVRSARSFHHLREEKEAATGIDWELPFKSLELPTMTLLPIGSGAELFDEGRKMRNCAGQWIARCATGNEMLVSVRARDGRRTASASYRWGRGQWEFGDAKGPLNRPLDNKTMKTLRDAARLMPGPPISVLKAQMSSSDLALVDAMESEEAHSVSPAPHKLET